MGNTAINEQRIWVDKRQYNYYYSLTVLGYSFTGKLVI